MDSIKQYLLNEKKLTPAVMERMLLKFEKHQDIADEFVLWIQTKEYIVDDPIKVEGYTADDIHRIAPFLDGVGVFNFMISLREQPEKAKQQIASGFPRK